MSGVTEPENQAKFIKQKPARRSQIEATEPLTKQEMELDQQTQIKSDHDLFPDS